MRWMKLEPIIQSEVSHKEKHQSSIQFSSVQSLSRVRLFATPWITARQSPLSITNSRSSTRLAFIESVMPSNHLILCRLLLLRPQSLPASKSFPMRENFAWGGQSTGVSASASFLPKNSKVNLLQNGLVGSPCSSRDSQESSPTPQFKSISSLVLSFLHSPTLTSIHDHWRNHSLEQMDLCWQRMSLLFNMLSRLVITFFPRSKHLLI